jgi:RNA polymerase sigma-70 factor (ECF subfamily)
MNRESAARLHELGRSAWPGIEVDARDFEAYLVEHLPADDPDGALGELHAGDLYLACACARGDARAQAAFVEHFLPKVRAYLVGRYGEGVAIDETEESLRELLLVPPEGGRPKIAAYAGRGALLEWLRVTAMRIYLRQTRLAQGTQPAERPPITDSELAQLRSHYGRVFRAALEATLQSLSSRERAILRMHYLEGASVEAVAERHRVHHLTVSRWLARVRRRLLDETRRRLTAEVPESEWDSVMSLVQSRLDFSLRRWLATPTD